MQAYYFLLNRGWNGDNFEKKKKSEITQQMGIETEVIGASNNLRPPGITMNTKLKSLGYRQILRWHPKPGELGELGY